jgi:Transposase IS66 family
MDARLPGAIRILTGSPTPLTLVAPSGFTWSRNRDGPLKMLAGYRGYLQVDAALAYDDVFAQHPEIIEVGCTAHPRRYFKEALPTATVDHVAQLTPIHPQMPGPNLWRAKSPAHPGSCRHIESKATGAPAPGA